MVEDLAKNATSFAMEVAKKAIVALAIIIALLVFLFAANLVVDTGIVIVKNAIDLLQYIATTLL